MYECQNRKFENRILHPLGYRGEIPQNLNNPFNYIEHPVCKAAVSDLIPNIKKILDENSEGKMFAVLVVQKKNENIDKKPEIFYLAAFSGQLNDKSKIPGFVPPVFDLLEPDGYFKTHEREITDINGEIEKLSRSAEYITLLEECENLQQQCENEINRFKIKMMMAKERRDQMRAESQLGEEEILLLQKESQYLKAEFRRLKNKCSRKIESERARLSFYEDRLAELKSKRRSESEKLQRWVFEKYEMLNFEGKSENLIEIFANTPLKLPPAGTGDCCEPKLFQYAYSNNLVPVQIAMFWWGKSPANLIRHHLSYYPACTEKCKPILEFMLPGYVFSTMSSESDYSLPVLYEDDHFWVVDKPSGMLSVPGKTSKVSVISYLQIKSRVGEIPLEVHRLDMDTSGVVVVAKNFKAQSALRKMFQNRQVEKIYIAQLDGKPLNIGDFGTIELPLSPDLAHRPFQKVDAENGKSALTIYRVVGEHLVELKPLTGRTHQLRVHCAHPHGLGRPIRGDSLYGTRADRLHLYAVKLEFEHPFSGKKIVVESRNTNIGFQ